jgi:hypothetical protein
MKSIRGIETHCYFHENNEVRQYLIKDAISKIQDISRHHVIRETLTQQMELILWLEDHKFESWDQPRTNVR